MTAVVAAFVGFLAAWFLSTLKSDETRLDNRAKKYEELVSIIHEAFEQADRRADSYIYDQTANEKVRQGSSSRLGPMPKAVAIARVHFPEMVGPILEYNVTAIEHIHDVGAACLAHPFGPDRTAAIAAPTKRHFEAFLALDTALDRVGDALLGENREFVDRQLTARLRRALSLLPKRYPNQPKAQRTG